MAEQMQMKIDLTQCEPVKCDCNNEGFVQFMLLKKVPALLSPTGLPSVAMVQGGYMCTACGKQINLQEKLKEKEESKSNLITFPERG